MRFLTIFILTITTLVATPVWYLNMQSINSYELIGYGEGKSYKEAKLVAKEDIAKQIKSTISSNTQKHTSLKNDNINNSFSKKITETTSVELQGLHVVNKKEIYGRYYVALSYENLPFEMRFAKKLNIKKCTNQQQNPYLRETTLFKKLNSQIGCKLDIKLLRKDAQWYLSYKEHLEVLSKDSFEELFVTIKPTSFEYEPSDFSLKERDEFSLKFAPRRDGFLSVLSVYEDGTVSVLFENQEVKKSTNLRFPSKKSEMFLEAGLLVPNRATFDNYIAILDEEKLNLSRFSPMNESLIKGERNKKFDELISFIKDKDFGTILIRTRPVN